MREQKEVEFYAASVAAWYNSALEHDKSLLTLSAGGIGLLLTLLTTVGAGTMCLVVLHIAAISSFLVSIVSVLIIFARNRTHIEQVLAGTAPKSDPWLERLDKAAIAAFGIGTVFAATVGIAAAVNSYLLKEKERMANESKPTSTQPVPLRESFNKAANLQGADLGKSFNQVGNLQPQPAATAPASTVPVAAPAPAPAAPAGTPPAQEAGK